MVDTLYTVDAGETLLTIKIERGKLLYYGVRFHNILQNIIIKTFSGHDDINFH